MARSVIRATALWCKLPRAYCASDEGIQWHNIAHILRSKDGGWENE
jgi:hypothetical protein